MKVKEIHFVPTVPGQPIYVCDDKTIRIPYPDGRSNAMLWLSEEEVLKGLTKQDPATKNIVIAQFAEARKLIGLEKKRTILNIAGNA